MGQYHTASQAEMGLVTPVTPAGEEHPYLPWTLL